MISQNNLHFVFKDLQLSERLYYPMLSEANYYEILGLFQEDSNPFVATYYKDAKQLEEYVINELSFAKRAAKHAGCDWLIKRNKVDHCLGVLNIYELSRETFNNNHLKCMIGLTIGESFKRNYYGTEAALQLISYAQKTLKQSLFIIQIDKSNRVSNSFFRSIGFVDAKEEYFYSDQYDYLEYGDFC